MHKGERSNLPKYIFYFVKNKEISVDQAKYFIWIFQSYDNLLCFKRVAPCKVHSSVMETILSDVFCTLLELILLTTKTKTTVYNRFRLLACRKTIYFYLLLVFFWVLLSAMFVIITLLVVIMSFRRHDDDASDVPQKSEMDNACLNSPDIWSSSNFSVEWNE